MTRDAAFADPLAAADAAVREAVRLPPGARVLAAMSGGVDSTVTAALLKRAGYDVVGVTLQLYDHGAAVKRSGACCAGQDIRDARQASERIGIAHYVLDYESRFRQEVIDDFADAYLRGETPIPCVRCNQTVKFRDLLGVAQELGAQAMATGHYVQRIEGSGGAELHRGADPGRDQSYFLFATTREQLQRLRFPLGALPKPAVRAAAEALGLAVADKPDSQDICFVPEGRYSTLIDKLRPEAAGEGDIVHLDGRVLGRHGGVSRFTVGQRRGLNVALGEPLFVVSLNPAVRQVTVGPREALLALSLQLKEINWLSDGAGLNDAARAGAPVLAQVRSTRPPAPARLVWRDGGVGVVFAAPQDSVSPGQACVLYDHDAPSRVLGGGFIAAVTRRDVTTAAAAPLPQALAAAGA
jgi:tRNA-specific 2-thiouridylase